MIIRRDELGTDFRLAYRPSTIDEFVGNKATVKAIKKYLELDSVPHNVFFSGPSGTGKTTMAHILSLSLCCSSDEKPCLDCQACSGIIDGSWLNVIDVNCGSDSGKAVIEDILSTIGHSSFIPGNRVYIFEECHRLSTAAKSVFLRNMDKSSNGVYMIFCTNQPDKLKDSKGENPFISRCAHYKFKKLSLTDSISMINNIVEFEGKEYSADVINYICKSANGIPRDIVGITGDVILSNLNVISDIKDLISGDTVEDLTETIDFCRCMLKKDIKSALKIYNKLSVKTSTESVRMALCGYLLGCLKRSGDMRISTAIDYVCQPIIPVGKAAEYIFINSLFKVVNVL